MSSFDLGAVVVVLPVLALVMTVLNVTTWPRGRRGGRPLDAVVLIPARNEASTIHACIGAALVQNPTEVLVYDDHSEDETAGIVEGIADPRVRLLMGGPLPQGWVGKPHACHRLAEASTAGVLVFVDADVELEDGALDRIATLFDDFDADVVSVVPRQRFGSFAERMIVPLLHVTYVSWLPLALVWRSSDPRLLAANGQVLAVRRAAYETTGGFAAVRNAVVDDMAFCRAQKEAGHTVVFADGHRIACCRMYKGARQVWAGFSKNIYEGLGSSAALVLVIALYFATFVLPWLLLLTGSVAAIIGVAANVAQRGLLVARHDHPLEGVVLHPLTVLALIVIALNSWAWHARDQIQWRGRTYLRKAARDG